MKSQQLLRCENFYCERTKDEEWLHILSWNSQVCQKIRRNGSLEDRLRSGQPSLTDDQIAVVKPTMNDLERKCPAYIKLER